MTTHMNVPEDDDSFVMMDLENMKNSDDNKMEVPALKLSVAPKHDAIGIDAAISTTQVCATFQASEVNFSDKEDEDECTKKRAPVDIVVALDLSHSMFGSKLDLSKETLKLLLRCLSIEDRFGLVTFADEAKVEIPLAKLSSNQNKEALTVKIETLKVNGCTNMSGALGLAAQEMHRIHDCAHKVRCVFLLSDGCANRGVTNKSELENLAKGCFNVGDIGESSPKSNVVMHCFGYGNDHDEAVMQGLADATQGGTYYFVEGDSDVVTAFGDALGGVLSVVAQNVTLRIKPNVEKGIKIQDVLTDQKRRESDGAFVISLGDFYAGERRDVLFSVALATNDGSPSPDPIEHATLSFSYLDVLQSKLIMEDSLEDRAVCWIARPSGMEISTANHAVSLQWLRIKTTEDLKTAKDMCQKGDIHGAREFLSSCLLTLKGQPKEIASDPLLQHLATDVKEVLGTLQDESTYGLVGAKTMSRVHYGHKKQRCAGMSVSQQTNNTYATSSKREYMRKTLNMSKDHTI